MKEQDPFRKLIKKNLEEETREISFSLQARKRVMQKINNRPISLSLKAISLSLILFFLVGIFYTRTFFYISEKDLAEFRTKEKIIIHDDSVPFGALQHLVLALEKGKGDEKP